MKQKPKREERGEIKKEEEKEETQEKKTWSRIGTNLPPYQCRLGTNEGKTANCLLWDRGPRPHICAEKNNY